VFGRERLAEVSPCRPEVSHRWHTLRDIKGRSMRVHARLPTPLGSLRRFLGIRGCAATPRGWQRNLFLRRTPTETPTEPDRTRPEDFFLLRPPVLTSPTPS